MGDALLSRAISALPPAGLLHATTTTFITMSVRRAWLAARRRWGALGLGLALALALASLAPGGPLAVTVTEHARVSLPVAPARLAHLLADYSYHPHTGSWVVEEDRSNYTSWSYSVSYSCGARCSGRARVVLDEAQAGRHRVVVAHRTCTTLPLLPWPPLCEEAEVESVVEGDGAGGAVLREAARARCGLLAALPGACRRGLRDAAARRHRHLRHTLAAP